MGKTFLIRTDHYSLKYLLEQRLSTSPQVHWISKLLGFDFSVEYRSGMTNKVAGALSRCHENDSDEDKELHAINVSEDGILARVRREIQNDNKLGELRDKIIRGEESEIWEAKDGLIFRKGVVYMDSNSDLVRDVMTGFHNSGHEGSQKTMERIRRNFYWRGWKKSVQEFVSTCQICQKDKWETLQPAGLMQPLSVPTKIWADISMDFVEALPKVSGKTVILVVVDRFSKYVHSIAISHPYTAVSVVQDFFRDIVRLHGIPETIVSDRDKVFAAFSGGTSFDLCVPTCVLQQPIGYNPMVRLRWSIGL